MKKIISPSMISSLLIGSITAFSVGVESSSAVGVSLTTISIDPLDGQDCSGVFGQPFKTCDVGNVFSDGDDKIEISPIIAKFNKRYVLNNGDEGNIKINNSLYPSIEGNEFTFSNVTSRAKQGVFTYTRDSDDPYIKYWVESSGSIDNRQFRLNFKVDSGQTQTGGACESGKEFTLACVQQAQTIDSFSWNSPNNRALKHLTVYNTENPDNVPEPITLLATFAGLGFAFKLDRQYREE